MSEAREVVIGGNVVRFPRPEGHEKQGPAEQATDSPAEDEKGTQIVGTPGGDPPTEVEGPVVEAELVEDTPAPRPPARRPAPGPPVLSSVRAVSQRATAAAKRPDRVALQVARFEVVDGTMGLVHAAPGFWRWLTAAELDQHLATNPKLVLDTRRWRRWVAMAAGTGVAGGITSLWLLVSPVASVAAILTITTTAAIVERHHRARGEAEAGHATLGPAPSSKEVRRALVHAKLAKQLDQVRIVGPVTRCTEGAWEATAELPPGTTYKHATKRRGELAGAIGVDEVQVALDPVKGHHGRVRLWVSDEDPMQGERVINPLTAERSGGLNFWRDPVFVGRDARGRAVEFSLVERSYLVGGEPGGGKSVASNNILASVFMDPRTRVILADGKFGFDLMAWEPMAHTVLTDKDPGAMLSLLTEIIGEMDRRYALLRKIGAPKVTEEIATKYGKPPIVLHIDEIQYWSASGDTKANKEFIAAIADIVGRGRAAGIVTGAITQRPAAEVVPTRLRDILSIRWALRCTTPDASDTVLGSGWSGRGYSAALFTSEQRGAGYVLAEGSSPIQTRSAFIDPDRGELDAIARQAYALREQAGTLPATGDRPEVRLLSAVLEVMGGHPKGAHTADLLERLPRVSGEYEGWDAARLSAALRPLGVSPVQMDIDGRNRNGYRRADITQALERV